MLNDRGGVNGRKIELITEDNEWSAQKSVTATRKLVLRDNIFAMIGPLATPQINPVLPMLEEHGVPLVNAFTGPLEWFNPVRANIYGVYTPLEFGMQACGRWAAKDGAKKILVPYFDAALGKSASAHVEAGAKSVDGKVEVEFMPIKIGTVDYVPHALEIIRRKPDAIVGANVVHEFVAMVRELRTQGSRIPVYTGPWNVYDSLVAAAPQQMEGVKGFSFTQSPLSDASAVREYRDAMAKYVTPQQKPDFVSLFTFAGAKVFAEAVSRVKGEFTLQAFHDAMNSLNNYDSGILPPITFTKDNHLGHTSLFKVVARSGHWVPTGELIDAARTTW